MNYYASKTIPERLTQAEEIIKTVSFDELIRTRLADKGYTESEFEEMQLLLGAAQKLETNQRVQLGKQAAATKILKELTQAIRLKFVSDRRITRFALKNNSALIEELRLRIATERNREALVRQMTHFYEEVVKYNDLVALLTTEYNLTLELLTMRMVEVTALADAMQQQQYQIGEARVATQQRREAMNQLDSWMRAFIGTARQAFRGEEENLKKLRIHVQARSRLVEPPPPSEESDS